MLSYLQTKTLRTRIVRKGSPLLASTVHAGPGEYHCFSWSFNHPQLRQNNFIMERDPDSFDLTLNLSGDNHHSPGLSPGDPLLIGDPERSWLRGPHLVKGAPLSGGTVKISYLTFDALFPSRVNKPHGSQWRTLCQGIVTRQETLLTRWSDKLTNTYK